MVCATEGTGKTAHAIATAIANRSAIVPAINLGRAIEMQFPDVNRISAIDWLFLTSDSPVPDGRIRKVVGQSIFLPQ
ncbi:hypothetical protein [Nitratireductor sp. XY-223]|uniref:hypothetical protein n=1 Tax=Nitratireductor sp. XY-223 TaxID=2561926 RepID=UPI00145AD666|nr:hypothetical protein [Nitratireductor sp. XY-223]